MDVVTQAWDVLIRVLYLKESDHALSGVCHEGSGAGRLRRPNRNASDRWQCASVISGQQRMEQIVSK